MSRNLYVDGQPRLGRAVQDGFRCHYEWWLQMSRFASEIGDKTTVTAEEAAQFADLLASQLDQIGFQIHLHFWGDYEGAATHAFIKFLRGGSFSVVG